MTYITAEDLQLWFGAKELAEVAGPDDQVPVSAALMRLTIETGDRNAFTAEEVVAADAALARIEEAIVQGERMLESYLSRRFSLPLDAGVVAASPLPRVCGALARAFLYEDLENREITRRRKSALGWLRDLAEGRVELAGLNPPRGAVAGGPSYATVSRVFDEQTLQGFA